MRPFIDAQIVSEEAGCGKPDDEFFRLGLNRLGVEGKDCVHFGDNEITDGACKDLGMKFVLVEGYKNPECTWGRGNKIYEPDARIDRLTPESMQQVLRELENRNN
jgi:FMN phosphatase YigB (HAD superfamily)